MRIGLKQRKNLHTGGQAFEKIMKADKAAIGIAALSQALKDYGLQAGEDFARARRARRPHATGMPAAHQCRNILRARKAHLRQRLQRIGVILAAGEHQIAARTRQAFSRLEQQPIFMRDAAQMRGQRGGKISRRLISGEAGKGIKRLAFARQGLCLLVQFHLQPVLHAAQIIIGRCQRLSRLI